MKKTSSFFLLFFVYLFKSYAQVKELRANVIEKEIVKVNDTLYAFRYETSNFEYNIFLNAIAKKDSALYKMYRIDSLKWMEELHLEAFAKYYHWHPSFNNYPALCMSYGGAVAYCNWLTEIYTNDPARKFRKVSFVLPTEQEWELAAIGNGKNITYPWGTNSVRNTRNEKWLGAFMANYRRIGDASIVSDNEGKPVLRPIDPEVESGSLRDDAILTSDVRSFWPNSIGIYNQG